MKYLLILLQNFAGIVKKAPCTGPLNPHLMVSYFAVFLFDEGAMAILYTYALLPFSMEIRYIEFMF